MKVYSLLIALIALPLLVFSQKKKDEPTSVKDDLVFLWKKEGNTISLSAKSKSLAPIELILRDKNTNKELKSLLLPSLDSITIISLPGEVIDSVYKQVNDSLKVGYYLGHPSLINPDLDFQYQFPYKKRKKYEVSQGFNGKATHNTKQSMYAIDFQLNIGEPVHAARGGTVIKVVDWFTKKGGKELRNAANRILILHDDGTIATYAHLDYKGSFVKEGDQVVQSQKIGVSGLTGFTRGPHLHFVVRKARDISIPVYFKGYEGKELKRGKRYKY